MYSPKYFKNKNSEEIKQFLIQNSFGVLINQCDGKICGSHIPLELDTDKQGQDVLIGHISKANPQWRSFTAGGEVMAIFQGPHCYVSSSWYQTQSVPTWNYQAVHVYGSIEIITHDELMLSLQNLVDKYELGSENPVAVKNMSAKTLRQNRGIVGFKITIKDIQAVYKLSQNKDDVDYKNIITALEKKADYQSLEISKAMKKIRSV
ncbi:MAG: FMN-binding negative transcriptional regulator [Proteobacteria bacterium]|nr:FMN-binding negative transcriptional regulator [Pseudomonadota bacterium]